MQAVSRSGGLNQSTARRSTYVAAESKRSGSIWARPAPGRWIVVTVHPGAVLGWARGWFSQPPCGSALGPAVDRVDGVDAHCGTW